MDSPAFAIGTFPGHPQDPTIFNDPPISLHPQGRRKSWTIQGHSSVPNSHLKASYTHSLQKDNQSPWSKGSM